MPDKINILKICAILAAGTLSLYVAARSAESYAVEVAAREKTLAEAIMQSQLEEELKKAEEKLKEELEKQEITIVTTEMETKPPETEPPETEPPETEPSETEPPETEPPETEPPETEPPETETSEAITTLPPDEEIITEFTRGGILPADRSEIKRRTMFTLTDSEQTQVINFLVERYFLDGYVYSESETRPALKEKKCLAAQMEDSVVKSFAMIFNSVNVGDISSVADTDFTAVRKDVEALRDEFREKYADAGQYGEQFASLYDDSLKYFDRLVEAIGKVEYAMAQYKNAANPLLALGILTNNLNDVIIPEIMAVLEQSFDLVEVTQDIFLEGTQGTRLLSREEVRDIIENPALALYVIKNGVS